MTFRISPPKSFFQRMIFHLRAIKELTQEEVLKAVAPYFDQEPESGSIEADKFELLLMVIEAYEA